MRKTGYLLLITLMFLISCKKEEVVEDIDYRDYFEGTYKVNESWTEESQLITQDYTMTIQKSTKDPDKVILINIGDYGAGISAEGFIDEYNLTIPNQKLSNSYVIEGSGIMKGDSITFSYSDIQGSYAYIIIGVANKL